MTVVGPKALAKVDRGIVRVTIPKSEEDKPKKVAVVRKK